MDDLLFSPEMEALRRLAGRPLASVPPRPPSAQVGQLRLRVRAAMLELLLQQLEEEPAMVAPTQEDLVVLLTSRNQRIRTLGIRLSAGNQSRG